MYKTEQEFSKDLCLNLRQLGSFVTKIESHDTCVGIPDIYTARAGLPIWLELKNDPKQKLGQEFYDFHWRPGQIAWHQAFRSHAASYVLTVMAVTDGIVICRALAKIQDTMKIHGGKVPCTYDALWEIPAKEYEQLKQNRISRRNIVRLLEVLSRSVVSTNEEPTYRDMITEYMFKFWINEDDYDPEVLWPYDNIDEPRSLEVWNKDLYRLFMDT